MRNSHLPTHLLPPSTFTNADPPWESWNPLLIRHPTATQLLHSNLPVLMGAFSEVLLDAYNTDSTKALRFRQMMLSRDRIETPSRAGMNASIHALHFSMLKIYKLPEAPVSMSSRVCLTPFPKYQFPDLTQDDPRSLLEPPFKSVSFLVHVAQRRLIIT